MNHSAGDDDLVLDSPRSRRGKETEVSNPVRDLNQYELDYLDQSFPGLKERWPTAWTVIASAQSIKRLAGVGELFITMGDVTVEVGDIQKQIPKLPEETK